VAPHAMLSPISLPEARCLSPPYPAQLREIHAKTPTLPPCLIAATTSQAHCLTLVIFQRRDGCVVQ
jgi:hypothetical protein